jgi:hypothetical protein
MPVKTSHSTQWKTELPLNGYAYDHSVYSDVGNSLAAAVKHAGKIRVMPP